MSARTGVAATCGAGIGALAALVLPRAGEADALAVLLASAALALAAFGYAVNLWLGARRPTSEPIGPAFVVFVLSLALGLMVAGGHAHG
jgi:hypothetical protein